jgi:hypothetical protein
MERAVRDLAGSSTVREPGSSFEYANENWIILGVVIEKVSGLPYRVFMDREVFGPLGMARTTTDPGRFESLGALYGHNWGPDGAYPSPRWVIAYSYACGSELRSTARDMGRYLGFLISGGIAPGGKRFLRPDTIAEMTRGRMPVIGKPVDMGGSGNDDLYGYGLFVSRIDGRALVNHGGNRGNMSSFMEFDPATGLGVCLLFPADTPDPYRFVSREKIANDLLHIAAGQPLTEFGKVERENPVLKEGFIETTPELVAALIGDYKGKNGDSVAIRFEGGRIIGETSGSFVQAKVAVRLRPNDRFVGENIHGAIPGFFTRGVDGKAVSVSYNDAGRILTFYRVSEEKGARVSSSLAGFSFISPPGLTWTWTGARSSASVGMSSVSIERLSEKESLGLEAKADAEGWIVDSIKGSVWLEKTERGTDGRMRFTAFNRDGFLLSAESLAAEMTSFVSSALLPALSSFLRERR